MRLSSLITPWRIYDQYHDLNKFNVDCTNGCEYELITDKARLLPLQFQRDKSPFPILKAWLRPVCEDFYTEFIPNRQATFFDNDNWQFIGASSIIDYRVVFPGAGTSWINATQLFIVGNKYRIKIIVSDKKLSDGQTLTFCFQSPAITCVTDISDVGTHIIDFTATNSLIALKAVISGATDFIKISEFSIYEVNEFDGNIDFGIPTGIFDIVNIGTKDLISYCGSDLNSTLDCGKYYLVIQSIAINPDTGAPFDTYFFSEVITIKDFVPSQSPYILLEWSNTCDLQDVKYTGLDCNYVNRFYVDGPITKPEYPYIEEGNDNGDQVFKPTFKKLEKKENIIVPAVPEFVADSLMSIRLHDTIKFYEALKKNQQYISEYEVVESIESENEPVLDDCFSTVNLKVLLSGRFISTACCTPIVIVACQSCTYTLDALEEYDVDIGFALITEVGGLTLYEWNGTIWVVSTFQGIVCVGVVKYYYFGGFYFLVQSIATLVDNANVSFTITGYALPNTVIEVEITYNGVTTLFPTFYTRAQLLAGITIAYADVPITLVICLSLDVRVRAFDPACDYGWSAIESIVPLGDPSC